MNLTPETPSNIVGIDAESQKELEIQKAARDGSPCSGQHKNVLVNSKLRTVTCQKCGHVIDPFTYIEQWALDGDRRMTGLKGLDARTRVASAELERLLKQIDSIRGALKRAGHPQPQQDRDEFKNALHNAEHNPQRLSIVQPHRLR